MAPWTPQVSAVHNFRELDAHGQWLRMVSAMQGIIEVNQMVEEGTIRSKAKPPCPPPSPTPSPAWALFYKIMHGEEEMVVFLKELYQREGLLGWDEWQRIRVLPQALRGPPWEQVEGAERKAVAKPGEIERYESFRSVLVQQMEEVDSVHFPSFQVSKMVNC